VEKPFVIHQHRVLSTQDCARKLDSTWPCCTVLIALPARHSIHGLSSRIIKIFVTLATTHLCIGCIVKTTFAHREYLIIRRISALRRVDIGLTSRLKIEEHPSSSATTSTTSERASSLKLREINLISRQFTIQGGGHKSADKPSETKVPEAFVLTGMQYKLGINRRVESCKEKERLIESSLQTTRQSERHVPLLYIYCSLYIDRAARAARHPRPDNSDIFHGVPYARWKS